MSWLAVTPAFNEAVHLPRQAASLAAQTTPVDLWVVVDDGSTDATSTCVDWAALPFRAVLITTVNSGGLASASELVAFRFGVQHGLSQLPEAERLMKLDADMILDPDFVQCLSRAGGRRGLIGGSYAGKGELSSVSHVPGGLRAYSREAYYVAAALPAQLGWDVIDEVAVRRAGLGTMVVPGARATSLRTTGSSVGLMVGRYRKGVSSRWSGYHPLYALLQLLLHLVRRPLVLGGLALGWGYATAGTGPFPAELRAFHRAEQAERLRALARHPVRWLRSAY